MVYVPKTWVDEVLAGSVRYDIKEDDGTPIESNVQVSLNTTVVTPGSPMEAGDLNNIEDGLGDHDSRLDTNEGRLDDLEIHKIKGTVSNPNGYFDLRELIPLIRADADLTITRIHIHGPNNSPVSELDIDLKFADDGFDGVLANATIIQACDTTNGVFTKTSSFTDATVPSGKYLYWSFGAQPHEDWTDFAFEIYYTYD